MMIDLIGAGFLLAVFIKGYRRGLVEAIFSLLAVLVGMLFSLKLSHFVARFLVEKGVVSSAWASIGSVILLFVILYALTMMLTSAVEQSLNVLRLTTLNKLAGGALYLLGGLLVWSCLLWFDRQVHWLSPATVHESRTYPFFIPVAPYVFDHLSALIPFAKGAFSDLQRLYSTIDKKIG